MVTLDDVGAKTSHGVESGLVLDSFCDHVQSQGLAHVDRGGEKLLSTRTVVVDEVAVAPTSLVPKRWDTATTAGALRAAREVIASVGEVSFEADEIEPPLRRLAEERSWKAGDLFMAVRVAVTGRTATPPLFDSLVALGRERVLERLDAAISTLDRSKEAS